jgi:transposase
VECLDELHLLEKRGHIDLFYGDESGFSLNCVVPYCWQFPGEAVEVLPQKGKAINTLGIMNSSGDQVLTFDKTGSIDSEFVVASVTGFAQSLTKISVLVLDNARIHHSKIFQAAALEWEQKGLYIFHLPKYSPHLNRIEVLWRETKYRWIKPQDYQNLETLKLALDNIWMEFGGKYSIKFKK